MLSPLSMVVGGVAMAPLSMAIACRHTLHPLATCALFQTAASGIAVSVAASKPLQAHTTQMLGKDPSTGRFHWWSWVLFWPYHISLRLLLRVKQLKNARVEPLYNHVGNDWYIGAWPSSTQHLPQHKDVAVVDVTAELPANATAAAYRCLPVWDTTAPTYDQIQGATQWALEQRKQGRAVFVHCAHGHGRSCVVLCAMLVAAGIAADEWEALAIVKAVRPLARLNAHQMPGLQLFLQQGRGRGRTGKPSCCVDETPVIVS